MKFDKTDEFAADWKSSYAPQLAKRDPAVVPLVNRMVAESAALRGPYTMTGKVTRIANVGGTGQIRFTVLSSRHCRALPSPWTSSASPSPAPPWACPGA